MNMTTKHRVPGARAAGLAGVLALVATACTRAPETAQRAGRIDRDAGAQAVSVPPPREGAIGDDGLTVVLDEVIQALARDDPAAEVARALGSIGTWRGRVIDVRPRPPWLARATVAWRDRDRGVDWIALELTAPVAAQALIDALVLSPATAPPGAPPPVLTATFDHGSVEVRMDAPTAGAVTRLTLRWLPDEYAHERQTFAWDIQLGALVDELPTRKADEIAASFGIRRRGVARWIGVTPRPRWLAGAVVRDAKAGTGPRTIVELSLVDPVPVTELAGELDLEPSTTPDVLVPRTRSSTWFAGDLTVTVEATGPGEVGRQRVRYDWAPLARPRAVTPSAAIAATPWYGLVRELEQRLARGDDADAIEARLASPEAVAARPWLTSLGFTRTDRAPSLVGLVTLDLSTPIAADDLIAAFGHYEEDIPIHFFEEPLDLAFDPIVTPKGTLRITATLEEPGTRAPDGTVRWIVLRWEPSSAPHR